MRSWWRAGCVLLLGVSLLSCGSGTRTGYLYLTSQGTNTVSAFTINLDSGVLSSTNGALVALGKSAPTGSQPTAMLLNPAQTIGYVADYGSNDIATFSINHDGTVGAGTTTKINSPVTHPFSLAMDSAGKFLFVADQGNVQDKVCTPQNNPSYPAGCSAGISVFSIGSDGSLSEVSGSPFPLLTAAEGSTYPAPISITGVAVSNQGNFIYVTEQNNNIVVGFAFDSSSGALTQLASTPVVVGVAPSAVFSPPTGAFLYVANAQSNDISEFTIDTTNTTSAGTLTAVAGSPVATGVGPIAFSCLSLSNATYLYAIDNQASQVSAFNINLVTGVLKPLSPASVSAGTQPVAATIRSNGQAGGNYWMIVSANGGNAVTTFNLNPSTGGLASLPLLTAPVAPYGLASK